MSNPYQFTQGDAPAAQAAQSQAPQGNGMAVAALVLGIIAAVLFFVPFLNWVLAILAIIFGGVGMSKGKKVGKGRGMAMAGLILGIVGAVAGTAIFIAAMNEMKRDLRYALRNGAVPVSAPVLRA